MSDQKSLYQTLEDLLLNTANFSIALRERGRSLGILIDIEDDKYTAEGFTDNQTYMSNCDLTKCKLYPERYNIDQSTCKSCFQDIYYSRYRGDDNSYMTIFNIPITIVEREELEVLQDLIRKIEIGLIEAHHEILYSYPNSLKNYLNPRLLMRFEREAQDLDVIYGEIEEGRIYFVQPPTLREIGSKDQPIFSLIAAYGKPDDKVDDLAHLKYPKNFRFSLMVYEK